MKVLVVGGGAAGLMAAGAALRLDPARRMQTVPELMSALTDPNGPQPNMDILLACYRASAESVRNGSNRYAIDRAMLGLDDQPSTDFTADLEEPVW